MVLLTLLLDALGLAGDAPIRLEIERFAESSGAVEVNFAVSPGVIFRLYESRQLPNWRLWRTGVASTEVLRFPILADGAASAYFRLEIIPLRPLEQMAWIEPGEFVMGSPPDEVGRFLDKEEPQTYVELTRGFWISRFEVTQAEFKTVMGFNPSLFQGEPRRPVENVSWFHAREFCEKLTERERQAGRLPEAFEYRLPTEAEWEYAARARTTTRFSYGDDPGYERLRDYAWYGGNSGLRPHPVGQKSPNPWGLYDVHGNVFEWCSDWFGPLPGGSVTDPPGPDTVTDRNIRGGYWDSTPAFCRSAIRVHFPPTTRISYLGFRIVLAEAGGE
ncbi:MAG: formylglycine-generating enzyme family protein [Verrucomicrobia bacterium]|nr:formylglycine-generating enzyme family protein [Verrucomicrobiota bacterium]